MSATNYIAALLALLFIGLTVNVIRLRYKHRVRLGDGGHPAMQNAIRAQGNFVEYTPFFLILLAIVDAQSMVPLWVLHLIGNSFILGRLSHAHSLLNVEDREGKLNIRFRQFGMVLTLGNILILAGCLLFG